MYVSVSFNLVEVNITCVGHYDPFITCMQYRYQALPQGGLIGPFVCMSFLLNVSLT